MVGGTPIPGSPEGEASGLHIIAVFWWGETLKLCPQHTASQPHRCDLCMRAVCVLSHFSHVRLCDPMDCSPPGSSVHGDSPGKNTGMGCYFPLQGIFPTQGSNPRLLGLLKWQTGCLRLGPPGKPEMTVGMKNAESWGLDTPASRLQWTQTNRSIDGLWE